MKKYFFLCVGICAALSFSSCKSSESAYKKAYEKAKAAEAAMQQVEPVTEEPTTTVVAPVAPATQTTVVDNNDEVNVRQEKLNVLDGAGLQEFSVIVGAFGLKANAESMVSQLRSQGYSAQLAYNAERNLYRVVASTHSNKSEAVTSRDNLRGTYPDAWLLYNIR